MKLARDPRTGLTEREEAYCQARASGMNQVDAYAAAFPNNGRKRERSYASASTVESSMKVSQRINDLLTERTRRAEEKFQVSAERVIAEIAAVALSDVKSLFDERGDFRPLDELTPAERASIASIEMEVRPRPGSRGQEVVEVLKVKFWNKNEGLEKLARHLGLYEKDNLQRSGVFEGMERSLVAEIRARLRDAAMGISPPDDGQTESRTLQ